MTLHLVSTIDRTARIVAVDGHSERPMPFLAQIDEELVRVTAGSGRLDLTPYPAPTSQVWTMERGANGTIAAGHDAGATVTPVATQVQSGPLATPLAAYAVAELIDPASGTALADLVASLVAAGLMATPVAAALAFDDQPTATDAAATIAAVTVSVLDQAGSLLATDDVTVVTVALTTPGEAVLGGTTSVTAVDGVATFADLTVDVAATYTLTATATGLTADESDEFVVSTP